jgi:hypothetical protein
MSDRGCSRQWHPASEILQGPERESGEPTDGHEIEIKFRRNASTILPDGRVNDLYTALENLEDIDDVGQIGELLAARYPGSCPSGPSGTETLLNVFSHDSNADLSGLVTTFSEIRCALRLKGPRIERLKPNYG